MQYEKELTAKRPYFGHASFGCFSLYYLKQHEMISLDLLEWLDFTFKLLRVITNLVSSLLCVMDTCVLTPFCRCDLICAAVLYM